ncbi:MAG: uroporphyrinogen decarboxylase family protein [Candidatus Lokiarchaeota archaeon]
MVNKFLKVGFDAISLWDFRRGEGGYEINKTNHSTKVDGWGRVFKGDWYTWEGVFKNPEILDNWKYLILPSNEKIEKLKKFLSINRKDLNYILSLPGLFEKTWQSMGFVFFSKCLKKNQELIFKVVKFFHTYIENLVKSLKKANVKVFLIADDLGYKNRTFLPKDIWEFFFLQDYMDLVEYIKKDNESNVILHSDGYISSMMDLFIEIGFDAIQGLEPNAGIDIFSLFKQYRNKICFIGNVDVSTLLTFGTKIEVKDYISKLKGASRKYNSPLIVSPTQQIHDKVKPENLFAMIKAAKTL